MDNIIVIAIVALIVGLAVWYIRKEKRRGVQCIGCPDSKTCSGNCAGCSGCRNGSGNQP
ncbi:MAG: FeoB-associated Cys-rich membrane protein [Oscillospiraceae bacterium]|nr:FeoB-associated Cys-rich membrane protein [Oscillospiraceae bacterium]